MGWKIKNWAQRFLLLCLQTVHQLVNKPTCQPFYFCRKTNASSSNLKVFFFCYEKLLTYFQTPTVQGGYLPCRNLRQIVVAFKHILDVWEAGLTQMIAPSFWMRYVDCSLLSCVGGYAAPLVCKLPDFRWHESICPFSEGIPENISPVVKMITRWKSNLSSSKTSCLCSWQGSNLQKHYMGKLEYGKSVTFTTWHCLAKKLPLKPSVHISN